MKSLLKLIRSSLYDFVEKKPQQKQNICLKSNQIISTIMDSQKKQIPVHVIYQAKHFTGDIVKYDKDKGQVFLKNFQKNLTAIIALSDIDKVSLVPSTVKDSQLKH
ncbi:hypothetical protein [Streptococcus catagoni]|uniref:hypothetical protein n=1 Tax=Streptococcus catagoni TaxID=2654874 RepID=UPI001408C239|nr:hypothetical protein [Streptococcus catagoni]